MISELKKMRCHFDRSPDLSGRSGEVCSKIDSSTRLRLARNDNHRQAEHGFSLTEVLLAVGILAVGMLFIAGVFPVGIHFTTVATERTTAAIVADEAFAKIKLYGDQYGVGFVAPSDINQTAFVLPTAEHAYPSTLTASPIAKKYWWSAVCRRIGPAEAQVTVFVSRKAGAATMYPLSIDPNRPDVVSVSFILNAGVLQISDPSRKSLINDGYTIVDNASGNIYRVLERYGTNLDFLRLNEKWQGDVIGGSFWVVTPPGTSGRYPCIAVYQKVVRF